MSRLPFASQYLTEHVAADDFATLAGYERRGGYEAARQVLRDRSPAQVIDTIHRSLWREHESPTYVTKTSIQQKPAHKPSTSSPDGLAQPICD